MRLLVSTSKPYTRPGDRWRRSTWPDHAPDAVVSATSLGRVYWQMRDFDGSPSVHQSDLRRGDEWMPVERSRHQRRLTLVTEPREVPGTHMLAEAGGRDDSCSKYEACLEAIVLRRKSNDLASCPAPCPHRVPRAERSTDFAYSGRSHSAREVCG